MNYKYGLPTSKHPSKKNFSIFETDFSLSHFRWLTLGAISYSNLDYCIALYNSGYSLVLVTFICASVILQFGCLSFRYHFGFLLHSDFHVTQNVCYICHNFVWNFSETFLLSLLSTIYYACRQKWQTGHFRSPLPLSQPYNHKTLYTIFQRHFKV